MSFQFSGSINWYPGHMVTAWRELLRRVDAAHVLLEIRDARLPISCANPRLDELARRKTTLRRIVVLNKNDLADQRYRTQVESRLRAAGVDFAFVNARDRGSIQALRAATLAAALASRGSVAMRCNVLVAGFPNCGKSTIINAFRALSSHTARRTPALTGAKPGVTRQVAGFKVGERPPTYMLDSPGLMVPSNLGAEFGLKLALLACLPSVAVPDHVLLQFALHWFTSHGLADRFVSRYGIAAPLGDDAEAFVTAMAAAAHRRGARDAIYHWAAQRLVADLRSGALGPLMLEDFNEHIGAATSSVVTS